MVMKIKKQKQLFIKISILEDFVISEYDDCFFVRKKAY